MSLSLIFRLQAAFAALWAVQLIFLPGMMFAQYQWTPSLELVALGQGCGVAMTGLAIVAYQLPNWTTAEQLKMQPNPWLLLRFYFSCCNSIKYSSVAWRLVMLWTG